MNWVLDYFRLSADNRLLFGGRVNYSGSLDVRCASATRKRMLRVFPQLAAARIEYAWGGNVDITLNRAPHFGRLSPRVYFLQGFSGHGIALTGIAGKLVALAIAGTAERFDVFARIPHANFPGGLALRRPGTGAGDAVLPSQGSVVALSPGKRISKQRWIRGLRTKSGGTVRMEISATP